MPSLTEWKVPPAIQLRAENYGFDLERTPTAVAGLHPDAFTADTASLAYAWSSPIERSDKRRFFAPLHQRPVKSLVGAVRAALFAEHKRRENSNG
jgi:hypothetical protein